MLRHRSQPMITLIHLDNCDSGKSALENCGLIVVAQGLYKNTGCYVGRWCWFHILSHYRSVQVTESSAVSLTTTRDLKRAVCVSSPLAEISNRARQVNNEAFMRAFLHKSSALRYFLFLLFRFWRKYCL
jgi:hypothetical protein